MNYSLSVFPCSNVPRSTFLPDYRKSKFFNQLCEISTEISCSPWWCLLVTKVSQSFSLSSAIHTIQQVCTDLKLTMWSEKLKYRNLVKIKQLNCLMGSLFNKRTDKPVLFCCAQEQCVKSRAFSRTWGIKYSKLMLLQYISR